MPSHCSVPAPPEMVASRPARKLDLVPPASGVARLKFYSQEQSPKNWTSNILLPFDAIAGSHSNTHAHITTAVTDRKFFPRDEIAPTDAHTQREGETRGGSCAPATGGAAAAVNKPGRCKWVRTASYSRFGIVCSTFQSGAISVIQTGPNGPGRLHEALRPRTVPTGPEQNGWFVAETGLALRGGVPPIAETHAMQRTDGRMR